MLRWAADEALNQLIRRYYAGEAGLWEEIRDHVETEVRRRGITQAASHIRLRRRADGGYDVQIDDATEYINDSPG